MTHLTQYGRRMKIVFLIAMATACLICLFAIPFVEKRLLNVEVGYYQVVVNGTVVGAVNSLEDAQTALAQARLRFNRDYQTAVYMDPDIEIEKLPVSFQERMDTTQLASAIYSNLFSSVVDADDKIAYTVQIGDYAVTLGSKDDVTSLINKLTSQYNQDNTFAVSLVSSGSDDSQENYTVVMEKVESQEQQDSNIVAKTLGGDTDSTDDSGSTQDVQDITSISFTEPITVTQTVKESGISSVDEAYDEITKVTKQTEQYVVQEGDTLSGIAESFNMTMDELLALNTQLNSKSILAPGQVVIVTDSACVVSVVTTQRLSYEEEYDVDPEYVDDDTAGVGTNRIVTNGYTGQRQVTADVTYVNGVKTSVDYVDETILIQATPDVIAVGTKTQSNYIRPISGGTVLLTDGVIDETLLQGVDWAVDSGTSVMAAADGQVERAGWYADYGYCVDIRHSDGSLTRYGHLSEILVQKGQSVTQGQQIGYSGDTGVCSQPQLRFEIYIDGITRNPLLYVNKN